MNTDLIARLKKAFQLGQTYWQQADSESYSQNAKSDQTLEKFKQLLAEVEAADALEAKQRPIDCRTCKNYPVSSLHCEAAYYGTCTNGDKYEALPVVQLYRK